VALIAGIDGFADVRRDGESLATPVGTGRVHATKTGLTCRS
jgi:hypothetical protein